MQIFKQKTSFQNLCYLILVLYQALQQSRYYQVTASRKIPNLQSYHPNTGWTYWIVSTSFLGFVREDECKDFLHPLL